MATNNGQQDQPQKVVAEGAIFQELTEDEMKVLWETAKKHIKELKHDKQKYDLVEVDIGYRWEGKKITDEIAIRVHVREKPEDQAEKEEEIEKLINKLKDLGVSLVPPRKGPFKTDVIQSKYYGDYQLAADRRQPNPENSNMIRGGLPAQGANTTGWGTLGAIVYNNQEKEMALSNHHVFGDTLDSVLQPGPDDSHKIGQVAASDQPLDWAVAELNSPRKVSNTMIEIPGGAKGWVTPRLGMEVIKYGAASWKTYGMIEGVAANQFTVVPRPAEWEHQKPEISQDGDSGAVWLDEKSHAAVGLHKTGENVNDWRKERAHATRIDRIVPKLKLTREKTWEESLTDAPALAAKKKQLLVGWLAKDGQSLKFRSSNDGVKFDATTSVGGIYSADGPALAYFRDYFIVAWATAGTSELKFGRSIDGKQWKKTELPDQVLKVLSKERVSAPSLAASKNHLYLAWRDPRTNRVRVMKSEDGMVWSKMGLRAKANAGPSLAATKKGLVIAWRRVDYRLVVRCSQDEKKFDDEVFPKEWTACKPALFGLKDQLFCAWAGIEDQRLNVRQSIDGGQSWGDKITLQKSSISSPAIAKIGDAFIWVWTNKDGNLSTLAYDMP